MGHPQGVPVRMANRRSIRLKSYDYSQAGFYFVTICAKKNWCVFGEINNGQIQINDVGMMIKEQWQQLPRRFNGIILDAFIVMPNHIHGIIKIVRTPNNMSEPVGAPLVGAQNENVGARNMDAQKPTLGDIIGAFKSLSTNEYIRGVKENGWVPFEEKLWHRNYYEHIIRDNNGLNKIREYIIENPSKWDDDEENPGRGTPRGCP